MRYVARMFAIAFSKKRVQQVKTNCYAQSAQIRQIRGKMVEIMTNEAGKVQLRELVKELIPEAVGKEIGNQCEGIFLLQNAIPLYKRISRSWHAELLTKLARLL